MAPSRRPGTALGLLILLVLLPSRPAAGQGATPTALTTTASGPVTRRGQITDTARLTGAAAPTGTITFTVYGPDDPTCAARPAATSTRVVTGEGSYVSAAYSAPTAGVYRFIARYSGDAATAPAAGACGDPGESVRVSDPPPPVLGASFQVGPLSGRVYVRLPPGRRSGRPGGVAAQGAATGSAGFVALPESRTIPVGSLIDATAGRARITTATSVPGVLQAGSFASGVFQVRQSRGERGLTELDLAVGAAATGSCPTTTVAAAGRARAAARRHLSRRVLALLRSDVAGRFRTRGRFSAATVRGTSWETIDRCDGTLTRVGRGVVVVADLGLARSVVVGAGHSYLARAP